MVKVTKSIKIYQYFRYLKFASSASKNAGKCVSKSPEIQNFLGGGGMPPDPPREQGPPGLATPTQINATPTSKTVENPVMTCHHPDLVSASDWLNQISHTARPIRSTTQIWVVTRHQYGISALVSQTPFGSETSGSIAKCRLFSQAI